MGPDGRYPPGVPSDHAEVVDVNAYYQDVKVTVPFLDRTRGLVIEGTVNNQYRTPGVVIHGGNTNDGDAATYEQAARRYGHAVEVARRMEQVIANPDLHDTSDDEQITRGCVYGEPDYVLALYLILHGEHPIYQRGVEPRTLSSEHGKPVNLDGLREWAIRVALERRAVARAATAGSDLVIHRHGELMLFHVEATTEEATGFVDAYMPEGHEYQVIDSGRIIFPEAAQEDFLAAARERGLTWEVAER